MIAMETVKVEMRDGIAWVILNRPEVRNAFNETLVRELAEAFAGLDESARAVVLTGEGKAFCAGADLKWMQKAIALEGTDNAQDASAMVELFDMIDRSPRPVIGRINGPAIGGGLGLVCCCDMVVTVDTVRFGFSEVRLGVAPAVISPYCVAKIGLSAARRYFLTGELFSAERAREIGLVHEVVPAEKLDAAVEEFCDAIRATGPKASAAIKELIFEIAPPVPQEVKDYTVKTIARLRISPEAQEGFAAFLGKRKPNWPL